MGIIDQGCSYYPVYGHTLRTYEVPGIFLSETTYQSRLNIPLHTHEDDAYFNLVLRGDYAEHTKKRVQDLGRSELVFHPAGAEHSNTFSERGAHLFNIRLESSWRKTVCEQSSLLTAAATFKGGLPVLLVTRLYNEFRAVDAVSALIIEGLVLEMLGETSRSATWIPGSKKPRWLAQAQDLVHSQFNQGISLRGIAEAVGVHKVHLSRAFRRHFHCTVGEYARRLQVEFSCRKLSQTNASLLEITSEAGFSDQGHFCRTFKRFTGLTPTQYRASFR